MHQNKHTTTLRHNDDIDVYVTTSNNKLTHFWANPSTNWQYKSQVLADDCITRCASMRLNDDIDLYFINTKGTLVHFSCSPHSNWQYKAKEISWNLRKVNPTCIRNGNDIDVYCVDNNGSVVHLWANPNTDWKYQTEILFNGNAQAIHAIRTLPQALDIHFVSNRKLYHGTTGNHTDWKYKINKIFNAFPVNNIGLMATRVQDNIDVYFTSMDGTIHQVYAGPHTQWNYHYKKGQC